MVPALRACTQSTRPEPSFGRSWEASSHCLACSMAGRASSGARSCAAAAARASASSRFSCSTSWRSSRRTRRVGGRGFRSASEKPSKT